MGKHFKRCGKIKKYEYTFQMLISGVENVIVDSDEGSLSGMGFPVIDYLGEQRLLVMR